MGHLVHLQLIYIVKLTQPHGHPPAPNRLRTSYKYVPLADLYICLLILGCVLFTMIDVVGVIYMLGLTIDPFSLASIIIGIGLSVDYSVHIAHAFMISEVCLKILQGESSRSSKPIVDIDLKICVLV